MARIFSAISEKPALVSLFGALAGWQAFDWLKAAQVASAVLASLVSFCALVLTAPKAYAQISRAVKNFKRRRSMRQTRVKP